MEDKMLVKRLKKNDETVLEVIVRSYNAYVCTVIANQLGGLADTETVEELASDAFFALWQNRCALRTGHLRGWLGTTARNKARSYLRKKSLPCEPLDDYYLLTADDHTAARLEKREQSKAVEKALLQMEPANREIVIRFYYYNQKLRQIAEEMNLNPETVKSRLKRGRAKLKSILEQGGYFQ